MKSKALVLSCLLLSGCFGSNTLPVDPWPADADLRPVDYPMRESQSDAALGDAYLRSLGEIEKANSRLKGVREAKKRYLELIEED